MQIDVDNNKEEKSRDLRSEEVRGIQEELEEGREVDGNDTIIFKLKFHANK